MKFLTAAICAFSVTCLSSCDDEDIVVTTGCATNITQCSADAFFTVDTEESLANCSFGILYSESRSDVEKYNGKEAIGRRLAGNNCSASLQFQDLNGCWPARTKVYYRAYVAKKSGETYSYGEVQTLVTGTEE